MTLDIIWKIAVVGVRLTLLFLTNTNAAYIEFIVYGGM